MRALLGVALVLGLACGVTAADEKIDAAKLIGKWKPKDPKKEDFTVDFKKDGKVTFAASGGKDFKIEGTYKLDGNKLTMKMSFGGKDEMMTRTISKLTDTELTSKDDKKGEEDTLVRVKEAKK